MFADLAFFEGATHAPRLDAAALTRDVFGPSPKLNILIAEQIAANQCRRIAGLISYFPNYSSWEGRAGIHISDLWVPPAVRGQVWDPRCFSTSLLRLAENASTFLSFVTMRHASFMSVLDSGNKTNGVCIRSKVAAKRLSCEVEEGLTEMLEIYLEYGLQNPRLFEFIFLEPELATDHESRLRDFIYRRQ
jgi:hypothetical protein